MTKMKLRKRLALVLAMVLCISQLAVPAMAKGGGGGHSQETGTEYIAVNIGGEPQVVASSNDDGYLARGTYGESSVAIDGNDVPYEPEPYPQPEPEPEPQPRTPTPRNTDGEIEIIDEQVPLANVPATGDISGLWAVVSTLSLGGAAVLSMGRKKR